MFQLENGYSGLLPYATKTTKRNTDNKKKNAKMVKNNAGGDGFAVDDTTRLLRFLILGCEGGTFYATQKKLGLENAQTILRMLKNGQGASKVVPLALDVSKCGRAAKQTPTLFVLAMAVRLGDAETRTAAYKALPQCLRTPTMMFEFISLMEAMVAEGTGWGRGMRKAVAEIYNSRDPTSLAMWVTKYRSREGWCHRDVLRLAHVKPASAAHQLVVSYAVKDELPTMLSNTTTETEASTPDGKMTEVMAFLTAVEEARHIGSATSTTSSTNKRKSSCEANKGCGQKKGRVDGVQRNDKNGMDVDVYTEEQNQNVSQQKSQPQLTEEEAEAKLLGLIAKHTLVREHIPSQFLNSVAIWNALLVSMPMTAMMRNLAKMTSIGLLKPLSVNTATVCERLRSASMLQNARVHPFGILLALKTYESGHGQKGSLTWNPVPEIVAALDDAFNLSFKHTEPTGKRFMLGMDVSGSMTCGNVNGSPGITPRVAAAAMAMVTMRTEQRCHPMAFTNDFVPLKIDARMSLQQVTDACNRLPFGGTDCAQPMLHALKHKIEVDVFIVYTDCETWAGNITAADALRRYRRSMGIPARLAVVAMTSGGFTIADPSDKGMLDMVGFDASAPQILREFALGQI